MDAIGMTLGEVVEHCRGIGKPGETLLRTRGGRPIELSSLSARFAECIRMVLGPDAYREHEWPSLHELRSLAARSYVQQGMDPQVVQTLLGHSNLEMTQIYMDDRGLTAREYKRVRLDYDADLIPVGTGLGLAHADQPVGLCGVEPGAAAKAAA